MPKLFLKPLGSRFLVLAATFVIVLGFGLFLSAPAHASEGDGSVMIKGVQYDVMHDGNGPFIDYKGMHIDLQGHDSSRFVVVGGVKYWVSNVGDNDHQDHNDHNDHNDHKDHKDHTDSKDHHDHGNDHHHDHGDHQKDHHDDHKE